MNPPELNPAVTDTPRRGTVGRVGLVFSIISLSAIILLVVFKPG